jgi:gluconolactonase
MRSALLFTGVAAAVFAMSGLVPSAHSDDKKTYPTMGTITRDDPQFDQLVPKDARIEKLADGMDWAEGPVWIKEDGSLLFSDIPKNSIFKWKEGEGKTLFLKPAGYSGSKPRGGEPGTNGLLRDADGNLVMCEHGDRRVSRLEKDKSHTTLADKYQGKRLNSPNDGVFKSNGDLYFTDPPYGLEKNWEDPARELDFCGVYRVTPKGELTLLTKEISRPNGIAFSPDEKTLYVACSDYAKPVWMAYDVQPDGTIAHGRVFFDATPWIKAKKLGLPDGMKVDKDGNIFATGPGGVHVFTPQGKHLGSIDPGVATANCGWGDDGSTLYMTADKNLCRIKLNTKGKGF